MKKTLYTKQMASRSTRHDRAQGGWLLPKESSSCMLISKQGAGVGEGERERGREREREKEGEERTGERTKEVGW